MRGYGECRRKCHRHKKIEHIDETINRAKVISELGAIEVNARCAMSAAYKLKEETAIKCIPP